MKLIKKNLRQINVKDFSRVRLSVCLEVLGIIEKKVPGRGYKGNPDKYRMVPRFEGFWGMNEWDLVDTLKEVKETFKRRIMELHPDKNPNHEKEARAIIAAYKQAIKLFKRHNITTE